MQRRHLTIALAGLGILGLAGLALPGPAEAHHGWGSYDASRTLTLDGVVEKVVPDNPHAELVLRADGRSWQVILSPPYRMANRGKAIAEIKAGDRLIAVGYASKQHENEMRAERITHNGVTVELR
ncbi:DUF6152 family protein [Ferrovibrio sp.]|uniref:DUF6152 family protein n=1 Tax=Ferrovibrio sp. TaxID=1917215 RepID=UPI00311E240B